MAVGGSMESISIGGREFAVTADADITRQIGGYNNETPANGNGTGRLIKTRVVGGFFGVVVECDDDKEDHEYLQGVADSKDFVVVAGTYPSGAVYQGLLQIAGELSYSPQSATASFDLSGGVLTKQ